MPSVKRTGTQSIERAMLVLREVATRGQFGWALGELAARCGIDRTTTHRILACLKRERMVQQRESNRHYALGPLIFELGLAIPAYAAFQARCRTPLIRLSERYGTTSALFLRSGPDWVCMARAGLPVYGGTILEVGTRRPLLSGAGGVAMLLAMPAHEARAVLAYNRKQLKRRGHESIRRLENMLRRSEALGYAFNQKDASNDTHSFGVPLRDPAGRVFGALAIGGRAADLPASRANEIVADLQMEAERIEAHARDTFAK